MKVKVKGEVEVKVEDAWVGLEASDEEAEGVLHEEVEEEVVGELDEEVEEDAEEGELEDEVVVVGEEESQPAGVWVCPRWRECGLLGAWRSDHWAHWRPHFDNEHGRRKARREGLRPFFGPSRI